MRRRALFSGSWYPSDRKSLDEFVRTEGEGERKSAVLPHSGLYYSGDLISLFFSSLSPSVTHVTIISPSHYYYLEPDTFYTASFTSSSTPYGDVETIPLSLGVKADRALEREHGVEMFLPFAAKKGLSVSYALLSSVSSHKAVERLAGELSEAIPEGSALIASSDFTHYGPDYDYMPFGRKDAKKKVESWDSRAAALLSRSDTVSVFEEYNRKSTICGLAPAMVVSRLNAGLEGSAGPHYTSQDKGGGSESFVDYCTVLWS